MHAVLIILLYTRRGPNVYIRYFYFPFGDALFYRFRVTAKVQFYFGHLVNGIALFIFGTKVQIV